MHCNECHNPHTDLPIHTVMLMQRYIYILNLRTVYIYIYLLTIEANLYSTINKVKVAGFFIPKTHMAFRLILFSEFGGYVHSISRTQSMCAERVCEEPNAIHIDVFSSTCVIV